MRYLRVSLTDRCNYRCVYCMPAEGVAVAPRRELLDFGEIERLVRLFVDLGVRHVRLTGGEPLVRRDVCALVARLAAVPGVADLAMTTNAHLLPELAAPLRRAGLARLNVSLDSLDAARFGAITRGGDLARVLAGLRAADAAGFRGTKVNAVIVRGQNDDEIAALAAFCARRGDVLRLIEFMPIGLDGAWAEGGFVGVAAMRQALAEAGWQLAPDGQDGDVRGGGPARYWRAAHPTRGALRLGFITAVSEHFCATCNRVRVSATGTLRECLSAPGRLSLRDAMRAGLGDSELRRLIADAMLGKVEGHSFAAGVQTREAMSSIGG